MSENGQGRGEGSAGGAQANIGSQWVGMIGQGQGQMQPGAAPGMGGPEGTAWGQGGGQAAPQFQWQPIPQGQRDQAAVPGMAQGQWGQGAQQAQGQVFQGVPGYAQAGNPGQTGPGQAPAGYAYPPQAPMLYPYQPQVPMGYGYPPQAHAGYGQAPQGMGYAGPVGMAAGMGAGPHQGRGPGVSQLMEELAGGGNGLSSLTQMLNLDDKEMWKGALIGATVVLLLTNESVQNALFKTGVRARDAVKSGVDKVKARAKQAAEEAGASEAPAGVHE